MTSENQKRFGFLTMAFGAPRYLRQAENLALSLRLHMPDVPIAIVTDVRGPLSLFNETIPLDRSWGLGLVQKLFIDKYSPFCDTFFIDSDCIVTRPFSIELQQIRKHSFAPICTNYYIEYDDQFINLKNTLQYLEISRFPRFNGGVYYFTRDETSRKVFRCAREILTKWQSLGIKPLPGSSGPNEEVIFGLAMEMAGAAAYDDHGKLMRTPLGIIGRLEIEPLGGGTRFQKGDELVEPAICHFTGWWTPRAEYERCERLLRGERVGLVMVWFVYKKFVRTQVVKRFISSLERQSVGRKLLVAVGRLKVLTARALERLML